MEGERAVRREKRRDYLKMPERAGLGVVVVGEGPRDADFINKEAETPLLTSY